ncbi:MAG: winged helix-turn-helix transcriptional regulator, partial [Deltaproteobacteria bacterium]|nr:winged helix-turn-helix transcriptional regulator [Deltaproteobacteria bacterium]
MKRSNKSRKKAGDLNAQMLVIKDFIDEFYNKTLFQSGKVLNSDLTPSQIKSLFAFKVDDDDYPIGELGRNARVKSSTMTDMIDRLEKEKIVERIRDDDDRRVVKVHLTDKGKKIKREFTQKTRKGVETAFSKLSEEEVRTLLDHLN